MDFSWNYEDTMRRMVTDSHCCNFNTPNEARRNNAYSLMLKVDLYGEDNEVPTILLGRSNLLDDCREEPITVIVPLFTDDYTRQYSGAETIIKYFTRATCRLNKATNPKGEIYYGNNGIILDGDFNPLLFSTAHIVNGDNGYRNLGYNVYLSPKVFTDDTKMLNKSIAKKGITYYLSRTASGWRSNLPYKVIIDDCSKFFVRAHRPDLNSHLDRELNKVLKDNIDEVLGQIAYDYRGNV